MLFRKFVPASQKDIQNLDRCYQIKSKFKTKTELLFPFDHILFTEDWTVNVYLGVICEFVSKQEAGKAKSIKLFQLYWLSAS